MFVFVANKGTPKVLSTQYSVRAVVRHSARCRGFTLLEVAVAAAVLVLLMAVTVQMLGWAAAERRAAERRQWALQEATNVLERLTAQSWDSLTAEAVASVELSSQARAVLPDAELKIEVTNRPGPPSAKQLVVDVRWQRPAGQSVASVRLSSWVYRRGGGE